MTIQQLHYVFEISQNVSINKAAQNLFISQPTLSNAIKELEDEIGISLFDRTHKGVSITADGIEFLRMADGVLSQMEIIRQRYDLKNVSTVEHFQVSSQHYAFVVEAFINFMDLFENSKYVFSIKETKTLTAIDDVYTRKSALGVIFLTDTNERLIMQVLAKRSILFHELIKSHPHVFISKKHPLAKCESITLEQLSPYPMIVYHQDGGEPLSEEIAILENPEKVIYVHDRGTTNNIIANTFSYNIGTGYLIPGIIPEEITSVPLLGVDDVMRIGWIHLSGKQPTQEVERFVAMLEDSLHKYNPISR